MSSRSATRRASPASTAEQQPFLCAGRSSWPCTPVRMNRPMTSYPCCLSRYAATELSTPPLIASTTRAGMPCSLKMLWITVVYCKGRSPLPLRQIRLHRLFRLAQAGARLFSVAADGGDLTARRVGQRLDLIRRVAAGQGIAVLQVQVLEEQVN